MKNDHYKSLRLRKLEKYIFFVKKVDFFDISHIKKFFKIEATPTCNTAACSFATASHTSPSFKISQNFCSRVITVNRLDLNDYIFRTKLRFFIIIYPPTSLVKLVKYTFLRLCFFTLYNYYDWRNYLTLVQISHFYV